MQQCQLPRLRNRHGVAVARQRHARDALGQVGVRAAQGVQHQVAPVLPGLLGQLAARIGQVAQGLVVGQHGGLRRLRVQALVACVDVAQRAGVAVVLDDVVPRGGRARAFMQRAAQVQVADQPGRPVQFGCHGLQHGGRGLQHALRDEHGQRDDAALALPARDGAAGVVEHVHRHAMPLGRDAQHAAGRVQLASLGQRLGQALAEPAVAFGPGQHGLAGVVAGIARRVKAVAAGEVLHAGPGRHARAAGAKVVAAGVVQIPAQPGVGEALHVQPMGKGLGVQLGVHGRQGLARTPAAHGRHAEGRLPIQRR